MTCVSFFRDFPVCVFFPPCMSHTFPAGGFPRCLVVRLLMALGLGLRARVSDSGTRLHPCGSPPGSVSPPFLMGVGFGVLSSPFVGRGTVSLLYMCPSVPETKASCSHHLSPASGFCLHLPVIGFVPWGSALKHPSSPGGTRGEWGHL